MLEAPARLHLPPAGRLVGTGGVDALAWYYRPGLGWLMRRRLVWVRDAVAGTRAAAAPVARALEVGYGSGIFQYELSRAARVSVGIDVHSSAAVTRSRLTRDGVQSELVRGSGCVLPFRDGSFERVVLMSTLEFVPDPAACLREVLRVLAPGGRLVALTTRHLRWADRVLRRIVGRDPEAEFAGGRERVGAALAAVLPDAARAARPRWLPPRLAPYELVTYERR
ncbi:MAG TPA: class I SAM-dependent methyltransferase [Gemmatimonadales bacterium]|nr:class I SAM-dependent methyltransferase [Gemmatimonadales bacterium]